MNKHQLAFKWSAERLMSITGKLYFWTFTFKQVHHAWHYPYLFKKFAEGLENVAPPDTGGLRVLQVHPGEYGRGHGIHYHCLFNRYINAGRVWRLCRQHGMGCDAKRVKITEAISAVNYVSRYLTRDENDLPCTMRRWGAMWGFCSDRISDLKFEHPAADSMLYLGRHLGRGSFGSDLIQRAYDSPHMRGDYKVLMIALDYKQNRDSSIFNRRESFFENALFEKPFSDWVYPENTIYHPGFMPQYLPEVPF
jgi:hypothetical protein